MAKRTNPQALRNLANSIKNPKEARVGFFKSSVYEDGTPVAYVAAIQEFGNPAGGIPSRSFIRTTIAEQEGPWRDLMKNGCKAIVNGKATVDQVMEGMGLQAEGDMKAKISQISQPPLKAGTIKNRLKRGNKSQKPLVDTGYMLATLTHTVEKP